MWRRVAQLSKLSGRCFSSPKPINSLVFSVADTVRILSSPAPQCKAAIPNGKFRASFSTGLGSPSGTVSLLRLNDLRDNKGARKKKKRKGRGIGSGKGKTAGRGHKGQHARGKVKFGFEGGQTPLRRRLPKRGFKNPFSLTFQPVGLGKIAKLINAGKIDSGELITMKTLKETDAIGKQIEDGVRLMGRGAELIKWPIHLEVSRVTARAKAAVEALGGSVRRVHYNKLGLRALLKPEWFEKKRRLLPKPARPPPKLRDKVDSIGRLPAPTKPIPFTPEERAASAAAMVGPAPS
ncbi:50S ribosomal protein L15, chloroplastic [Apostasia shenzhenica]|uniref:50S ribosomal protein L15, chloroplastic n=1 Tax=Apostasia shenzhenica TaxID=1088818 RepID=A0A2I0B178_9ASPA|nr:50S ribosomal protein L15, chloroplastic [Apostasia shenzhenica]